MFLENKLLFGRIKIKNAGLTFILLDDILQIVTSL